MLPRGFAGQAELLAEELRQELGLIVFDRLDPRVLAEHLSIPVWSLTDLRDRTEDFDEFDLFVAKETDAFSAMTVFRGNHRVIVHNDAHPVERQNSNIGHELSHGVLIHEPGRALDERGCRDWNATMEAEADYLAGALLIPGKAARGAARRRLSISRIADTYACSIPMAQWRMNVTGATRLRAG